MASEKQIIYVDMDDVMCEYTKAFNQCLSDSPQIAFPQSQYGFFSELGEVDGAIDAVNKLRNTATFDVYVLTAPSIHNPLCYTEKRVWIEKHFDMAFVEKLIISPNKGLLRGHYLIDDHNAGKGQENFEGQLIQFGGTEFSNWQSVVRYFNKVSIR